MATSVPTSTWCEEYLEVDYWALFVGSAGSVRGFRYHRPCHTSWPVLLFVWFRRIGSGIAIIIYLFSRFLRFSKRSSFIAVFCLVTPGNSSWAPVFRALYNTPQLHNAVKIHWPPPLRRWYPAQLYISFKPDSFNEATSTLSATFRAISYWMSTNFFVLNPAKTEFLLTGTPQQRAKLTDSSILAYHMYICLSSAFSAQNLSFIFDEHWTCQDKISAVSKTCFYRMRNLRRIRPFLDHSTPADIAVLYSSTTNLITAIPSIEVSQSLNQASRLQCI